MLKLRFKRFSKSYLLITKNIPLKIVNLRVNIIKNMVEKIYMYILITNKKYLT